MKYKINETWLQMWSVGCTCSQLFDSVICNINDGQVEMSGALAVALVRRLKMLGKVKEN